jgi:protein-S-isoprenylcysteine O-methyltransferase Ste14
VDTLLKYLLPAYLVVYFGVAFLWRSYVVWKRTGANPYAFGKADNVHGFVGFLFRLTLATIVVVVILFSIWDDGYQRLIPITWLQHSALGLIGLGLLIVSLVWILVAQVHMGEAWRIGIDANTETQLVRHGLFRVSRNPIFLGMRFTLLGLFLVLPNAVTLTVLVLGDVLIQIQVRLEEEYLARKQGEIYQKYCQQTRRWL